MIAIRSILFNILFYGSTILLVLLLWPAAFLGRGAACAVRDLWLGWTMGLIRVVAGIDYVIEDKEKLPSGPVILAVKHQSAWETLAVRALFGDPAIVLKKELLSFPVFGWFLKAVGNVPVDRSAGAKALRLMTDAAKEAAGEGRQILIFPQGTRVAPGAEAPYQPGVFGIYRALGLPVVPVALNSGLYWGRNSFKKQPGTIRVRVLDTIPSGLSRKEMMPRLETAIETATKELEQT